MAVDHLGLVMVSSWPHLCLMSSTLAEYRPIWVPSGQSGVAHMSAHLEKKHGLHYSYLSMKDERFHVLSLKSDDKKTHTTEFWIIADSMNSCLSLPWLNIVITLVEYWPIWVPSGQSGVAHKSAHLKKKSMVYTILFYIWKINVFMLGNINAPYGLHLGHLDSIWSGCGPSGLGHGLIWAPSGLNVIHFGWILTYLSTIWAKWGSPYGRPFWKKKAWFTLLLFIY